MTRSLTNMARDSVGELRFDYMDEVCRPQGDAFANADLPLHHTVKKSVRFPLVRLHDVKRVFFPDLKAWLTNYRGVWGKGCCPFSLVDCHIILVSQVVTPLTLCRTLSHWKSRCDVLAASTMLWYEHE